MRFNPLTEEEFDTLDDDTKGIAGAWFGMAGAPSFTLSFQMEQARPTVRAQAALDNLVVKGFIGVDRDPRGPVTYRVKRDFFPVAFHWLRANAEKPEMKWPITEPIKHEPDQ